MSKRYKKKPIIVDALKWTGTNKEEVLSFFDKAKFKEDAPLFTSTNINASVLIETLEGVMECRAGDYIIKEVGNGKNLFYPCKPDRFKETYEELN